MLEHVCDKELRELRERAESAEDRALAYARDLVALREALWRARECCARPMGVCLDPHWFDGDGDGR
jgi:hypothetical protein